MKRFVFALQLILGIAFQYQKLELGHVPALRKFLKASSLDFSLSQLRSLVPCRR